MTVDYLSTLNSKGSGLNVTQLVTSIVDAEIEPAKALVNEKSSANDLSVSEIALMRSRMEAVQGIFENAGNGGLYRAETSSADIALRVTDEHALEEKTTQVAVTQRAAPQVLEFPSFDGADDTLAAGSITIDIGKWSDGTFTANQDSTPQSVTVTAATTLSDLAAQLTALDGVTAEIVDKGDGSFSLSMVSETGASNSLRLTSSSSELAAFDTTDGSNEVSAALNAQLRVNGISVERPSNVLDDIVAGAEITLRGVTSFDQSISVAKDTASAEASVEALISQINTLRNYIDTATARGMNGAEPGPLAGEPVIEAIKRDLVNFTTEPLNGFGADPVYLSEIGIQTELDGTLSLDSEKLMDVLDTEPEKFQALFSSTGSIDLPNMTVSLANGAYPSAGTFDFVYDDNTQTATLNGEALFGRTNADGHREFYRSTGVFEGVSLTVLDGVASDASVNLGLSLVDKIEAYLKELLSARGDVATKEEAYTQRASGYRSELAELDERALLLEAREMEKFAKMEQAVTRLKSTGEYITTMMDAWSKDD
jgi:flagellar hook-associated protein 2